MACSRSPEFRAYVARSRRLSNASCLRRRRPRLGRIVGSWPVGRRKAHEIVARRYCVVAVFSSGWKFSVLVPHQRRVEDDRDAAAGVVDGAERRHRAGDDAEQLGEQLRPAEGEAGAADPLVQASSCRSRHPPRRRRGRPASFLSLRKRFLVCPPAISPRSARLCSTVKSGGCSTVVVAMPSCSRQAKRSARLAGMRGSVGRMSGRRA